MPIKIYNTLHNAKEEFVPVEEGKVKMYVCGPTTYNYIHLGNARPIVAFDVIRRYFAYRGYDVTYVQNFTMWMTKSSTAPMKKIWTQKVGGEIY